MAETKIILRSLTLACLLCAMPLPARAADTASPPLDNADIKSPANANASPTTTLLLATGAGIAIILTSVGVTLFPPRRRSRG